MNKKIITLGALTAVGAIGILSTPTVSALSPPQDNLAERIATKFNLTLDEVKKVFNEEHQAREQAHQKKLEEKLQKKVDDKTITEEQKTKLLAKLSELREKRQNDKANNSAKPDHAEMKQKREAERSELQTWAKENGIDLQSVLPRFGEGHREHR
jgi:hydroxylamine reductase (hybrid-cluster protein)